MNQWGHENRLTFLEAVIIWTVSLFCYHSKSDDGRVGVVIDWNRPPGTACVSFVEVRGTRDKQRKKTVSPFLIFFLMDHPYYNTSVNIPVYLNY